MQRITNTGQLSVRNNDTTCHGIGIVTNFAEIYQESNRIVIIFTSTTKAFAKSP